MQKLATCQRLLMLPSRSRWMMLSTFSFSMSVAIVSSYLSSSTCCPTHTAWALQSSLHLILFAKKKKKKRSTCACRPRGFYTYFLLAEWLSSPRPLSPSYQEPVKENIWHPQGCSGHSNPAARAHRKLNVRYSKAGVCL